MNGLLWFVNVVVWGVIFFLFLDNFQTKLGVCCLNMSWHGVDTNRKRKYNLHWPPPSPYTHCQQCNDHLSSTYSHTQRSQGRSSHGGVPLTLSIKCVVMCPGAVSRPCQPRTGTLRTYTTTSYRVSITCQAPITHITQPMPHATIQLSEVSWSW